MRTFPSGPVYLAMPPTCPTKPSSIIFSWLLGRADKLHRHLSSNRSMARERGGGGGEIILLLGFVYKNDSTFMSGGRINCFTNGDLYTYYFYVGGTVFTMGIHTQYLE